MKRIQFLLLFLAITIASKAQEVSFFEASSIVYYEITGCTPNSTVQYYSEPGGGKMIHEDSTNSQGNLLLVGNSEFSPAFALSIENRQVRHFKEKEFTINDISINSEEGNVSLSWNAAVLQGDVHSFEIMKSSDSINYTVIGTIAATDTSNDMNAYLYLDDQETEGALYKIRVVSSAKGTRYTTQPLAISNPANRGVAVNNAETMNNLKIYPTVTHDAVHLVLPESGMSALYKVLNEQGQTLQAGKLNEKEAVISISGMPTGVYFITIKVGKLKALAKVLKL